jgi:hypothetical protein
MVTNSEALWQMVNIIISFIVGVWLGKITVKHKENCPYKGLWQQAENRIVELKSQAVEK